MLVLPFNYKNERIINKKKKIWEEKNQSIYMK